VNYLLGVNVLVAWGWSDHVDHERTAAWIGATTRQKATKLMTSAIPELGFVRVSAQRAGGHVTVAEATETLAGMVAALGPGTSCSPTTRPFGSFRSGVHRRRVQPMPTFWTWPQHTARSWPRSTPESLAPFSFPPGRRKENHGNAPSEVARFVELSRRAVEAGLD
jgi:hypothetical protein